VSFYTNGRRIARDADFRFDDAQNASVDVVLALPGGKGGFGSMLRSIGAKVMTHF
jgi:hypothetical protein